MEPGELEFFGRRPALLPLYLSLREGLLARCPETAVKVSKAQLSFCRGPIYAMVSLPGRRRNLPAEPCLLVSFGLGARAVSPRIAEAVEPYPGRWTHHVPVAAPSDLDGELYGWLEAAYDFAAAKRRRRP